MNDIGPRPPEGSDFFERLDWLAQKKSQYKELRRLYERAKDEHDAEQGALHDEMVDKNLTTLSTDEYRFERRSTDYGHVTDPEAFVEWCESEGHSELLVTKYAEGLINEMVRSALADGRELPPGVSPYIRDYIAVTKRKP